MPMFIGTPCMSPALIYYAQKVRKGFKFLTQTQTYNNIIKFFVDTVLYSALAWAVLFMPPRGARLLARV